MKRPPLETRRAVVSVSRDTHAKLQRAVAVLTQRGWKAIKGGDRRDRVTLSAAMDAAADCLLRALDA